MDGADERRVMMCGARRLSLRVTREDEGRKNVSVQVVTISYITLRGNAIVGDAIGGELAGIDDALADVSNGDV